MIIVIQTVLGLWLPNLDRSQILELRSANEHAEHPTEVGVTPGIGPRGEGGPLRAIGVAYGPHLQQTQGRDGVPAHLARQQDCARAGTEPRAPVLFAAGSLLVAITLRRSRRKRLGSKRNA